jgi:hypothetical protein
MRLRIVEQLRQDGLAWAAPHPTATTAASRKKAAQSGS